MEISERRENIANWRKHAGKEKKCVRRRGALRRRTANKTEAVVYCTVCRGISPLMLSFP